MIYFCFMNPKKLQSTVIYRNHQTIHNSAVVTELFYKPFVIYFNSTMY